jgi:acetyl esterase/lipase
MQFIMSCALIAIALFVQPSATYAQTSTPSAVFSAFGETKELPLYSGVAPGSEKWDYDENIFQGKSGPQLKNVVRPTLLYYPASKPTGTAMIVAPGGGTKSLMMSYEGFDIAKKLNSVGVDAFVLKYRLIHTGPGADNADPAKTGPQAGQNIRELAGQDGVKAMELLRTRAKEFNIQADRIGMIGFSAGGGPARAAMSSGASTRPNFVALIYGAGNTAQNVVVPEGAPPLFLAVAADDANFEASIKSFMAWRTANIPVELHVFQMGAHGFVNKGGAADQFMDRVTDWIRGNGWLPEQGQ